MNLMEHLDTLFRQNSSVSKINEVCRSYVNEGIKNTYPVLYPQFKDIVDNYSFIEYRCDSEVNTKQNYGSIVVGVGAIIGCIFGEVIYNFPIIGTCIGLAVGVLFLNTKVIHIHKKKTILAPKEHAEALYSKVLELEDNITDICEVLDENTNNCLDAKYFSVLELLHELFDSFEVNDSVKNDIRKLLEGFGYKLVEFDYDNSYLFNKSFGNLNSPATSVHALKNLRTDECIIKGHVILPMDKVILKK